MGDDRAASVAGMSAGRSFVDSHVHVGLDKYRPVEDYLEFLDLTGASQAVLVQHLGQTDNGYLKSCIESYPGRFAAVGIVDHTRGDVSSQIARLHDDGFVGLRLAATVRSPNSDGMDIWRALDDHAMIASIAGPFDVVGSDAMAAMVREYPNVRFRFEHMGWVKYGLVSADSTEFEAFLRLGDFDNTSVCWSGFFLNSSQSHPHSDADHHLERAVGAFGSDHTMWSGDWNRPDFTTSDHTAAIEHIERLNFLTDAQRVDILVNTAASLFQLGDD